jgi:hypothetical protein
MNWTQTTQDGWATFLAQFQCYGTEPESNTMVHRHRDTCERLGKVVYNEPKEYFINAEATSEKKS